jgi:hypothetical protein
MTVLTFTQPLYPVIILGLVSMLVIVASDILVGRIIEIGNPIAAVTDT